MILYLMLVALGFFLACFMFVLVAPSFWSRAVRLTRRRIESTMPLTISEIEAEKDQLRASFAVKIRRLESALGKSREKSSHQLVEISRMQMGVTTLQDEIASLERSLNERRNAASVFEMTIKKRFPELENALAASQATLAQKSYEVTDLHNKLRRREEALALAQRSAGLQQAEITRLREAMEKSGSDKSTRFKKRPSQWSLDEYRAEYDRLNVELSKLREQLSGAYDREANQITFLKAELQQLAEQIIAASPAPEGPRAEIADAPLRGADKRMEIMPPRAQTRRPNVERSLTRPQPWLKNMDEREVAEVEIISPKAPPSSERVRLRNTGDDLANKSLQEVLEAALPMSGEAVVVREVAIEPIEVAAAHKDVEPAGKVELLPKNASSLIAPILQREAQDVFDSGDAEPRIEPSPPVSGERGETVVNLQPRAEKSLRALFDVSGLTKQSPKVAPEAVAEKEIAAKPIKPVEILDEPAKLPDALKPSSENGHSSVSEPSTDLPQKPDVAVSDDEAPRSADAPSETETGSGGDERELVSTKRTLLERLRGMDDRVG